MKKYLFGIITTLSLFLAGCNTDSSNDYAGAYDAVAAGIGIYNSASTQHSLSLDGAGVAVRLAMLLDEATSQGKSIDEVTIKTEYQEYRLRDMLFGRGVTIKAQEGDYLIAYQGTEPASLDSFYRQGSYRIKTSNLALGATTEMQPWVVTPEGEVIVYQSLSSSGSKFIVREGTTRLSSRGNGSYRIALEGLKVSFEGYDQFSSDWSGVWCFAPSTTTGDLSFSNHDKDTFRLFGSASGATFYAYNNTSTTRMSYSVAELTPLCWRPSETGSHTFITSSEEVAELTHPSDYSQNIYPASKVTVKRNYRDGKSTTQITYNGATMEL